MHPALSGAAAWVRRNMKATFRALGSPGYSIFLLATLFVNLGLGVQLVAEGWVVHEITGSAAWLGVTAACARIPFVVFAPLGGVFADRYDRRVLLGAATLIRMVPPFLLAIAISLGYARVWCFVVAAVCLGVGNAFGMPTTQAMVRDLVPKPDIPSAVAMQVGQFQMARALGPLLASGVFAVASVSAGFHVTALCCVPLMLFCFRGARPGTQSGKKAPKSVFAALQEGFVAARANRTIAALLIGSMAVSLLLVSYPTLFPVLAKQLDSGVKGNAYLGGSVGVGAFVGALFMPSVLGKRPWAPVLTGAAVVGALAMLPLAWAPNLFVACALSGISSAGATSFMTVASATLQQVTPQEMLGRIMSLNLVMINAGMMLGSLLVGGLASYSLEFTFTALGSTTIGFALVFAAKTRTITA
jgi:MFS family permease